MKYGYMCKVDYDWELGQAAGSTPVYSSLSELKRNRPCTDQCGVVKVRVELEEIIQEEDYGDDV